MKSNTKSKNKGSEKSKAECLEQRISAIKEGTALDHIPSRSTLKVLKILQLKNVDEVISVALNLKSKTLGHKGIIKVGGKSLSKKEIAKLALIAPDCTMNVIKNYKVKEKVKIKLPEKIEGVGRCINPNCITNVEEVNSRFNVVSKDPVLIRCDYCETMMTKETIIVE